MKYALFLFLCSALISFGQENKKEAIGKAQPGAVLERFTLKGSRSYDGIWDAAKSQIHIIQKSEHVANLAVPADEILSRKIMGDGSAVKLYPDVDIAEKVLLLNIQNYKAAQTRLATANRNRDTLHATYKGKNLPGAQYQAVMARYKAADDEIANAEKARTAAQTGFGKALDTYQKAGGKKEYKLP